MTGLVGMSGEGWDGGEKAIAGAGGGELFAGGACAGPLHPASPRAKAESESKRRKK